MIRAQKIYNHMQLYVKGQDRALKQIATLVALHLNRCQYNQHHVTPLHNKENAIIMGATGTGKTETFRALATYPKLNCPLVEVNALQYAPTGWKGSKSLPEIGEEIFRQAYFKSQLTELTAQNVDQVIEIAERAIICLDEFDKRRFNRQMSLDHQAFEMSYQGDLLKIMEGTTLEVQVNDIPRIYLRTDNMLFILMGAFNGFDEEDISRRVGFSIPGNNQEKVANRTGFITAESRKIDTVKGHVKDEFVKQDIVKWTPVKQDIIKGDAIKRDEIAGDTIKSSFINGKTLHRINEITDRQLIHYGFMEELVGRAPWRIRYEALDAASLVDILKSSKHSVLEEYKVLFASLGNQLDITQGAYEAIADMALIYKTGARALSTVVKEVLDSAFFDILNNHKLLIKMDKQAVISRQVKLQKIRNH